MGEPWRPGDAIALREIWRGKLWTARAATVVEDSPGRTILYVAPGMRWKCPVNPDGSWQRVPSEEWVLGDRVWREKHVLSFAWPGTAHAVLLYWGAHDHRFLGWYVNLQEPLRRSPVGFDYMDHMLDIEVAPDRSWRWKDEDELEQMLRGRLITPSDAREIRTEAGRAIERLERREEPFDDRWIGWRPHASWPTPDLPPRWDLL